MIVNFLRYYELKDLLESFLMLTHAEKTYQLLSRYFQKEITNINDLSETNVQLKYKKHFLYIKDFRLTKDNSLSVILEFKKKKSFIDNIQNKGNSMIVSKLKDICTQNIKNLKFEKYNYTLDIEDTILKYIYDARAFNKNWESGYEISPLLICPDSHDGNDFVEFLFNANCYNKELNTKVDLKEDWTNYIDSIYMGIKEGAIKIWGRR